MPKSGKRGIEGSRPSSLSQLSKRRKWRQVNMSHKHEDQDVPITVPEQGGPSQAAIEDLTSPLDHLSRWSKDGQLNERKDASSVVFHGDFNIRTPSDTHECFLNRMITMPDDRIVIIDVSNGCKVKLFSENYSLLDEVQCFYCTAVTCVDNNTITIVTDTEIVTYSVTDNKIKEMERKDHNDGKLYDIAYTQGNYILRYQKTGRWDCICHGTNVISKDKRELKIYDCLYYENQHDVLLVSCFMQGIIKCLTLSGELKWRVQIEGRPQGIAVVNDRVQVAVWSDRTVREITLDGQLVPNPLLTSPDRIETLAYQRKQGRLLVGFAKCDVVKVFNLTK